MKTLYAKTLLFAYPAITGIIEQIDGLVERKALSSMHDFSSCLSQCEIILELTEQKKVYLKLSLQLKEVLSKFTNEELDLLDYKFFKQKPKNYFVNIDTQSRGYFRKQVRLAKKFADELEKVGVTDDWYENKCLSINFFKELLKRVKESEVTSKKNLSRTEKLQRQTHFKLSTALNQKMPVNSKNINTIHSRSHHNKILQG